MRRRSPPEAIGLTMLDLICGLFALLVVLFAITPRVDGRPGAAQEARKLVRIQAEDGIRAPVALEIVVAGHIHQSWPDCASHGSVIWGSCGAGIVEAVVEGGDSVEDVRFMLLELPSDAKDPEKIQVWVTTPDVAKLCTLALTSGYRGHWKSESCKPPG